MNNIQVLIEGRLSKALMSEQEPNKDMSDLPEADSKGPTLQYNEIFHSMFMTFVWFMEHDPFTNTAMTLDVNCWKTMQENFKNSLGTD